MDGGHPRFTNEEIARRGKEIYEQRLRDELETEDNLGKTVIIDIENGEYLVDDDARRASYRLLAQYPGDAIYAIRIGHDAISGFGGEPQPTKR